MATVNIQSNNGTINVADEMVFYGGHYISKEELDWYNQDDEQEMRLKRERYERELAAKNREDHTLDELISMMSLLAQTIEALREEVHQANC